MEGSPSVWFNGALCFPEKARISPFDHGLTVGNGIFETMVAREGVPYALSRHYKRLTRSAGVMGLEVPSKEEIQGAIGEVLEANGLTGETARVRVTVTGGEAPLGSDRGDLPSTVLVAAAAEPVVDGAALDGLDALGRLVFFTAE